MSLLEVRGLCKKYERFALSELSFSLPKGYIMGCIGRNGAGKTTALSAITRLLRPDAGSVTVDGLRFDDEPVAYRDKIGFIGDSSFFYRRLTVREIRAILRDFYPSFDPAAFDALLEKWELPERMKIDGFSRGMKVKLMFASILCRETKLLILDEATNGLDPMARREILALLQEYISDGEHSVLFSTHILADLQDIADYILFIDRGETLYLGTRDELLESFLLVKGGPEELTPALRGTLIGPEERTHGFTALFPTDRGTPPPTLTAERPTVDEIVIHLLEERSRS